MIVMRWKTSEVVKMLEDLPCKVLVGPPGGDHDTEEVTLVVPGHEDEEHLHICGFDPGREIIGDPSDQDVPLVELTDGQTSSGGLNSRVPETCRLYAEAMIRLRGAGFSVVPHLKDYF